MRHYWRKEKILMRSCARILAVLAFVLMAAATITWASVIPLPAGQGGFVNPPFSRAACQLTNTDGIASYFADVWDTYDGFVDFHNPSECGLSPTYPYEIIAFDITLYGYTGATWPCTLAVIVHDAGFTVAGGDTCWNMGDELCRQFAVCDSTSFAYPAVGVIDFVSPCCVDGPFFIGVEYGGTDGTYRPSVLFDAQPVDTCDAWVDIQGTGWVVHHQSGFAGSGYPLWWVNGDTNSPNCPSDTCHHWVEGDDHKMHYPQLPNELGWNVNATWPVVLADDWRCTETGWVKDLHFWGSWKNGDPGYIPQFILSIHEDIPAGTGCIDTTWAMGDCNGDGMPLTVADMVYLVDYLFGGGPAPAILYDSDLNGDCIIDSLDAAVYNDYFVYGMSVFDPYGGYPVPACCDTVDYSMPGQKVWEAQISDFEITHIDPGYYEGWYDPSTYTVWPNNHTDYYQYDICLDEAQWFWQDFGTIYWLNISAIVEDTVTQWGWKSTLDHWNDDAVWDTTETTPWQELYEPDWSEQLFNAFFVEIDPSGMLVGGAGENAYGEGWYYYPQYDWWNIWFYDHPYDTTRFKHGLIDFDIFPMVPGPMYFEIAVNWSTDLWSIEFPDSMPPLPGFDEDLFIGREILFAGQDAIGHHVFEYVIPDYNPEWVSVDIRGYNFIIPGGFIMHECAPKNPGAQSLDLSFVITGEWPEDSTCCQIRGDIDHNGSAPDIADLIYMVTYMFQNGPPPPCNEPYMPDCPDQYYSEADVDGNGTCTPDIGDLIYLVTYMFQEGPSLVPCPRH